MDAIYPRMTEDSKRTPKILTSTMRNNMGAWWEMRCEGGHLWEVFSESRDEPSSEKMLCPQDGTPAITVAKLPLAERAVITIIPAAWEKERVVGKQGQYFVEMSSTNPLKPTYRTSEPVAWEKVEKVMALVREIPWDQAVKRWNRLIR